MVHKAKVISSSENRHSLTGPVLACTPEALGLTLQSTRKGEALPSSLGCSLKDRTNGRGLVCLGCRFFQCH